MSRNKKNRASRPGPSLKAQWQSWYERHRPVLNFGLKFGISLTLLYIFLSIPFFDRVLYGYLEANASMTHAILQGIGLHTQLSEVTIQSPQFAMAIRRGCDAVEPTWLLCAAMISFPASWVHQFRGILAPLSFCNF